MTYLDLKENREDICVEIPQIFQLMESDDWLGDRTETDWGDLEYDTNINHKIR